MRFSIATVALVSALFAHAAPLSRRQGAGFGAACDSILADEDTMEGETVRGAGVTVAKAIPRGLYARQGAGFGAACDSILADEDTMEGETVRGTGVTIANAIPQNGVPAAKVKRQLNGISDGVTAPLKAVSATKNFGEQTDEYGNTVDNELTQDSANEGAAVGELELETGTFLGGSNGASDGSPTAPPPPPPHKRQLNGISDGIAAPLKAIAPTKQFGEGFDEWGNQVDGTLTDDSAATGEDVGNIELTTGSYLGGSNGRSGGSR